MALHVEFDVFGDGVCVPVARRRRASPLTAGAMALTSSWMCPGCVDAVLNVFERGCHGAAALVPEHDDELGFQRVDSKFDRAQAIAIQEIAGDANDEQGSRASDRRRSQPARANRSSPRTTANGLWPLASAAMRAPNGSERGVPATKRALPALSSSSASAGASSRHAHAFLAKALPSPAASCGSLADGSKDRSRPQGLNAWLPRTRKREAPRRRGDAGFERSALVDGALFDFAHRFGLEAERMPTARKEAAIEELSEKTRRRRRICSSPITPGLSVERDHQASRRAAQGRRHLCGREEHALSDRRRRSGRAVRELSRRSDRHRFRGRRSGRAGQGAQDVQRHGQEGRRSRPHTSTERSSMRRRSTCSRRFRRRCS